MKLPAFQPSLGRKITLGYLAVAVLTLGVSLFTFEELRWFQGQILLGEQIGELLDDALELRRFERNYFLHHEDADRAENARYIGLLGERLAPGTASELPGSQLRMAALRDKLARYTEQMRQYAATDAHPEALESGIRGTGKEIVTLAEQMATEERQLVHSSLATFRTVLVVSIAGVALLMVAIGLVLSRRVVQPLKALEESVDALSGGGRDQLALPAKDREIVAIVNAFNHMVKELELRQRHLLHTEKLASLGTMLSGVAHELNNPLSNIWTANQLLLEELDDADIEARRQLLMRIDEQGERARNIVKSLLDFSRDSGFRKEPLALRELVDQTVRFIKGEIGAGSRVELDVAEGITVAADRQRLQQALLNLIRNGLEVAHTVSVSARGPLPAYGDPDFADGAAVIEIAVRDDGPGIAPDIQPRIFDPFFTTKEVGKGMGLGLFIVHQIVEEHEGSIAVTSAPGAGTSFRIRLPADGDSTT